jgi:hypothetical protein
VNHKLEYNFSVIPDVKRNSTRVEFKIPLSEDTQDFRHIDWEKYYLDCRKSLQAVAGKYGLEIIVWVIDPDESFTSVSHYVTVRGVSSGIVSLQIMRALRPCGAYRTLGFLARGIENDWPVHWILSGTVETQNLCRHDQDGERLEAAVSLQLLMRAIAETDWQRLIGPADKPWAYINTSTHRIYERQYETRKKSISGKHPLKSNFGESGDILHVADLPKILKASRFRNDAIAVLNAKAEGRKWRRFNRTLQTASASQ